MDDPQLSKRIILLTACILAAFGLAVLAGAVAAKLKGQSARPMATKYLAWFIIIPPILLPLVYSRTLFQVVVLLLSLQCIREFARATGLWADKSLTYLCYVLTCVVYACIFAGRYDLYQMSPLVAMGVLVLVPIFRRRCEHMLQKVCLSLLAVLYFGWFLSHLAYLRNTVYGLAYCFFLLILVECNDGFSYLCGKWLGRHRLIPRISPNKTVEGAVCGTICVVALGCVLGSLLPGIGAVAALPIAALVAVLGICGDLVVSFIKRDLGVKDMGSAIPGHGGVLDRCDSLILSAPAVFHITRYLHGA